MTENVQTQIDIAYRLDRLEAAVAGDADALGEIRNSTPPGGDHGADEVVCPMCDGSGEDFGSFSCEHCGGAGSILEPSLAPDEDDFPGMVKLSKRQSPAPADRAVTVTDADVLACHDAFHNEDHEPETLADAMRRTLELFVLRAAERGGDDRG